MRGGWSVEEVSNNDVFSWDERLRMVADSLYDLFSCYDIEKVSIFPLVNRMALLLQEPFVLFVFKVSGDEGNEAKVVFSNANRKCVDRAVFKDVRDRANKFVKSGEGDFFKFFESEFFFGLYIKHTVSDEGPCVHDKISLVNYHFVESGISDRCDKVQNLLSSLIRGLSAPKYSNDFIPNIGSHVENLENLVQQEEKRQIVGVSSREMMPHDEVDKYLAPMQAVLDDFFDDIMESTLVVKPRSVDNSKPGIPNIFVYIRTATNIKPRCNMFNFSTRIMLPTAHKDIISECFSCRCSDMDEHSICNRFTKFKVDHCAECITTYSDVGDLVEKLFGNFALSLTDCGFCSGVVDFKGKVIADGSLRMCGNKHIPISKSDDKMRYLATSCIFHKIAGDNPQAFIVPVIVGGTPWISILTVADESRSWIHNFKFYTTLINQSLRRKLRVGARDVYLKLVEDIIYSTMFKNCWNIHEHPRAMKNTPCRAVVFMKAQRFIDGVNYKLDRLCRVYPFDQIQFFMSPSDALKFSRPYDGTVYWTGGFIVGKINQEGEKEDQELTVIIHDNKYYKKMAFSDFSKWDKIREAFENALARVRESIVNTIKESYESQHDEV
jgi:hypothetical protein